jgi:hypothetical protein
MEAKLHVMVKADDTIKHERSRMINLLVRAVPAFAPWILPQTMDSANLDQLVGACGARFQTEIYHSRNAIASHSYSLEALTCV